LIEGLLGYVFEYGKEENGREGGWKWRTKSE
jgi:hypothetical protein